MSSRDELPCCCGLFRNSGEEKTFSRVIEIVRRRNADENIALVISMQDIVGYVSKNLFQQLLYDISKYCN